MEFGTVSAQSMMEEQLREVVVTGSLYADCDMCRGSFLRADLAYHKQYDCPARTVVCDICHVSYKAYEGHFCNGNGYSGSGPSSGPSSGNSSTVGDSGNTSSGNSSSGKTGQETPDPPHDPSRNFSVKDLRYKEGVKLVSYIKLPDALHPQTREYECVPRAYAFMAEMSGYDYDSGFKALDDIADSKERNFKVEGIYPFELTTFFKDYCNIVERVFDPSTVDSYIDKNIPVAVVTYVQKGNCEKSEPHMVTIIAYDDVSYYAAAGNSKGKATRYPKNEFCQHGYFYSLYNVKTPNK